MGFYGDPVMRTTSIIVIGGILAIAIQASSAEAALVANWNFSGYNGDDRSIGSEMGADAGATLTVDAGWSDADLDAVNGNVLNAVSGTPAGDAIQFMDSANNGLGFAIKADLTGFMNPVLSFAYSRPGNGFDDVDLFYSTDNATFTKFADVDNPNASAAVKTYDFSAINALDGDSSVFFRLVLSGASNASGTAEFDNIQLNAVPEPASLAMLGIGSLAFLAVNHRRRLHNCPAA